MDWDRGTSVTRKPQGKRGTGRCQYERKCEVESREKVLIRASVTRIPVRKNRLSMWRVLNKRKALKESGGGKEKKEQSRNK